MAHSSAACLFSEWYNIPPLPPSYFFKTPPNTHIESKANLSLCKPLPPLNTPIHPQHRTSQAKSLPKISNFQRVKKTHSEHQIHSMAENRIDNQTEIISDVSEDPVDEFLDLDRWPLFPVREVGDDGGNGNTVVPFSSSSSSSSSSSPPQPSPSQSPPMETYLVGFIIANVVGLQYYNGTISGREMVGLVRDPLNAHDEHSIRVLNTRSVQVGHIERTAARLLVPMMDSHLINVEGIHSDFGELVI